MKGRAAALLVALFAAQATMAMAVVAHGRVWQATYVAAYQPTFGPSRVPYSGTLNLKFDHGIVSGTYTSESVRPDPLYGRTIAVSGGVSKGQVTLNLNAMGGFTVRGTLSGDGEISGTATIRGSFYSFLAKIKSSP